ncbi:formimidoylglutamase [Antarcticibacterium arcticum]|uniref:Formimidoylglutamase n=1 Tax=Antarcticibacterium arcticum TaxID=2585771 RepID=A0A5B8YK19_9FLAO|nr:formimidoylglutamase [Antarcticibacterium arcticum]QED37508.1 formimidoylglutamase [Antarcticibacterium arcticum]
MEGFRIYDHKTVAGLIVKRDGESKFGEKLSFVSSFEEIEKSDAQYVLFGIPEDIGVRANSGKPGTSLAWNACLKALLNVQANQYTNPENVILLGEIDCSNAMEKSGNLGEEDPNYLAKLGDQVGKIDEVVSNVVSAIVRAGKIPVIIGGGHNNAYGNIKGTSLAIKSPLNVINIDAHSDLRKMDHRHSGNGFSYARHENFLGKYRVFGIHQNYTPDYIFKELDASSTDQYHLFEHLLLKSSAEINKAFKEELNFTAQEEFGLELDCDAISKFPSSAQSPTGFSFTMVRNFISLASQEENIKYFHICEAAPTPSTELEVGKALSYMVTDFIKPR